MKQILWSMVKPALVAWLSARALKLPAAKAIALAAKLGVSVDVVDAINDEVVAYVTAEIAQARL